MSGGARVRRGGRGSLGPTRRGWTLAGSAIGLLVGGRVLGADELSLLGVAALLLLFGALVWVRVAPPGLTVTRRVEPARLHVGDPARVDLTVTTAARHRSPLVDLVEPIDDGALRARFLVAPLAPGTIAVPAYRLPTDRRGAVVLGPAECRRTDPFGLAQRSRAVAPTEEVLVRPRVFAISPPALGSGRRISADDAEAPRAQSPDAAGDFLAVRPYEVGDDPRRVHWRSSARADGLMVRQFVTPRRGRTLVLLDTRAVAADDDGGADRVDEPFERAVEGAASVVVCLQRLGRPVMCRTSGGATLTPPGPDPTHRVLDRLARVARDEPDLLAAVARERWRPVPDLVVLVTAAFDDAAQVALAHVASRSAAIAVLTGGVTPPPGTPARIVDARAEAFPDAWQRATRASRPRPARAWTSAASSRPPLRSPR